MKTTRTRNAQANATAKAGTEFQFATECKLVLFENGDVKGFELYFDAKPDSKVLRTLKGAKFRWHSGKQCWYARQNADTAKAVKRISEMFGDAQTKSESKPEAKAQPKADKKASAKAPKHTSKKSEAPAKAEPSIEDRLATLEKAIAALSDVVVALASK